MPNGLVVVLHPYPGTPAPPLSEVQGPKRPRGVYHEARFRGDVSAAAAQIGEGFRFRSPFITSDSPTGHLDGLDGLLGIVTEVELISELYGETEATLVYDVHTVPAVGITQHTAEHFRLRDGRITSIRLIFDSAPWQAIMSAAGPTHDEAAPTP